MPLASRTRPQLSDLSRPRRATRRRRQHLPSPARPLGGKASRYDPLLPALSVPRNLSGTTNRSLALGLASTAS